MNLNVSYYTLSNRIGPVTNYIKIYFYFLYFFFLKKNITILMKSALAWDVLLRTGYSFPRADDEQLAPASWLLPRGIWGSWGNTRELRGCQSGMYLGR